MFSIPYALLDWVFTMFGMLLSFVGVIFVVPAVLQFLTMPLFFFLGLFGEVFLIPLSFISPILFFNGVLWWCGGDMLGLSLETYWYKML